jgi:hypothetical protein
MDVVIVNVYKHDHTFMKTPSLKEFIVEEKEGWQLEVEAIVATHFRPRKNYYLSYEYRKQSQKLQMLAASA